MAPGRGPGARLGARAIGGAGALSSGHQAPRAWARADTEAVARCPICDGARRELLHAGLVDRLATGAPGDWSLFRCATCGAGWIDRRPTRASVGRLYADYYTHGAAPAPAGGVATRLLHGYLNRRFGYALAPASRIGAALVPAIPTGRAMASQHVRHLARPPAGSRLLDVGCANGAFMLRMRAAGWEVAGIEFDERSARLAKAAGLEVAVGDVASTHHAAASFDAITLSHVIEHLHDPVGTLIACRQMLRPGGTIWVATPNLESRMHRRFGRFWAALDPPRHLVLFTRDSLRLALTRAGLGDHREPPVAPQASRWVAPRSVAMRAGVAGAAVPRRERLGALAADLLALARREAADELVLMARRPTA